MGALLDRGNKGALDGETAPRASQESSAVRATPEVRLPVPARLPSEAAALIKQPTYEAVDESHVGLAAVSVPRRQKPNSLAPAAARFGRYDVVGRLAVGGMAEIYLARETLPGGALRQCVLKLLRRNVVADQGEAYFEELFMREGRTAVQLAHPNICHVYEFGKLADCFFIAMEWVDGRPLNQVLSKLSALGERLPPSLAASIVAQVASALHYAHTARDARNRPLQVVHQDVNPQNIMLRHDGAVKLVDFGVAHVAGGEGDTRSDMIKGKPAYMAPEQLLGTEIDGRADVFALGVCLYEMLTGERLHKRDSMRETMTAVLRDPMPTLDAKQLDVPPALEAIMRRALEKQPARRFESAGEFQAALESFLAQCGEVASARTVSMLMERLYPGAREAPPKLDTGHDVLSYLRDLDTDEPPRPRGFSAQHKIAVAGVMVLLLGLTLWLWPSATPKVVTVPPAPRAIATPSSAVQQPVVPVAIPVESAAPEQPAAVEAPRANPPQKAPPLEGKTPKKRRLSPGFVADPGF